MYVGLYYGNFSVLNNLNVAYVSCNAIESHTFVSCKRRAKSKIRADSGMRKLCPDVVRPDGMVSCVVRNDFSEFECLGVVVAKCLYLCAPKH